MPTTWTSRDPSAIAALIARNPTVQPPLSPSPGVIEPSASRVDRAIRTVRTWYGSNLAASARDTWSARMYRTSPRGRLITLDIHGSGSMIIPAHGTTPASISQSCAPLQAMIRPGKFLKKSRESEAEGPPHTTAEGPEMASATNRSGNLPATAARLAATTSGVTDMMATARAGDGSPSPAMSTPAWRGGCRGSPPRRPTLRRWRRWSRRSHPECGCGGWPWCTDTRHCRTCTGRCPPPRWP